MSDQPKEQPCLNCGDETAPGSFLYAGRHELDVEGAPKVYLCEECYGKARAAKGGELTDADMRVIARNGVMMGAGFLAGGGF
jgi:hypothetical protein